jgi:hypothetical protein
MKKDIGLFILFVFCILFYSCAQDAVVKDDQKQEDNAATYSGIVTTVDFALPAGCRWVYTVPAGKSSGSSIINSQEELAKYLSCGETPSSVDFNKYSLLLAYGDTTRNVHSLTHQFVQVSENEFRLNVDIQLGTDAWPEGWTVAVLIPKIPQNTTIHLNEIQNPGNPGEYENPYRNSITGAWKLLFSIAGDDSLDCSGNHVIYDFQTENKLVVTGHLPGDLEEGEYAYEYKKTNVCPTCPLVPNMRIGNENGLFCEAYSRNDIMILSGKRMENGKALNRHKMFVKVDGENHPDESGMEEVPFMDYLTGESCGWINLKFDEKVLVINSKVEMEKYAGCTAGDFSEIDFSRQSLLLASGKTTSGIAAISKTLLKSGNRYTLKINVTLNDAAVIGQWVAAIVTDKPDAEINVEIRITGNQ